MKKKALAVIMTFVLVATAMIAAAVQPALAQDMEAADFSAIAGLWASVDTDEMLMILFGTIMASNRVIKCLV